MRRRESEGTGFAEGSAAGVAGSGGTSWVAGDWNAGAGKDLGISREENTEGERGKE